MPLTGPVVRSRGGLAVATVAVVAAALATALLVAPSSGASGGGKGDWSLRFRGTGTDAVDRVTIRVDGRPVDVGATDFTLELWLKGTRSGNPTARVDCGPDVDWIYGNVVLDRDRYNRDRKFGLSVAGGRLVWGVSGNGTGDRTICGTTDVLDDRWHHVAVDRRRSDGRLRIWVDGRLDAKRDGPNGTVSYPDGSVGGPYCGGECVWDPYLVVGAEKHDAGSAYPSFAGYLDELRISTTLRYSGSFAPPRGRFVSDRHTVGLYHFDEGAGTVVRDSSGADDGPSKGTRRVGGDPRGPTYEQADPF